MKKYCAAMVLILLCAFHTTCFAQFRFEIIEVDHNIGNNIVGMRYPQLQPVDDANLSHKTLVQKINAQVCLTLANSFSSANDKDSLWHKATTPELLEMYSILRSRCELSDNMITEKNNWCDTDLYNEAVRNRGSELSHWGAYFCSDHFISIVNESFAIYYGQNAPRASLCTTLNYDVASGKRIDLKEYIKDTARFLEQIRTKIIDYALIADGEICDLPTEMPTSDHIALSDSAIIVYYLPRTILDIPESVEIQLKYTEIRGVIDDAFYEKLKSPQNISYKQSYYQ